MAIIVLLVAASTWLMSGRGSDDSSVLVGEPPSTSDPSGSDGALVLTELWTADGRGMGGSFAPSSGQLVVTTSAAVVVAEGFGSGGAEPTGRVTALDRRTGAELWTTEISGPAFLQGAAAGIVIANTQHDRIVALDLVDGRVVWDLSLASLGLEAYGATVSAVGEPMSAVGVSATNEGDVRPPVVLGVDTASGEVRWRSSLEEGMDLQWGSPDLIDGEAIFTSTLSDPGSAEENAAHLLDVADGSIVWAVGLGGGQGFGSHPPVVRDPYVHLPAYPDILTVELGDGARRWSRPGYGAVFGADGLWMLSADQELELVDPATGEVIEDHASPIDVPSQLLDLGDGRLGVVSRTSMAVLDRSGDVLVQHDWPADLVDVVRSEGGELFVALADASFRGYSLEQASEEGVSRADCAPMTGDEPAVDVYAVTIVPPGFASVGEVERTETGPLDAGGESRSTLRLEDLDGRRIDVTAFGSYDPAAFLEAAQAGAPTETLTIGRCTDGPDGSTLSEQQVQLSTSDVQTTLGTQEWEYGGFLVVGGPDVTRAELLTVATGLRFR